MTTTELEAENFRLKALLVEVYAAMVAAGWHEDKDHLVQRVRAEAEKHGWKPQIGTKLPFEGVRAS